MKTLAHTALSATLAASLFAADVALLTLFLNPGASLRRDGVGLLCALFLPYTVLGAVALLLLALATLAVRGRSVSSPPLVSRRLPWFAPLCLLAVSLAAALFWANLLAYRHSIPLEFVRGLAASAASMTGAALVLVAVGIDVWLFPARVRGVSAALVVLACGASVVVPLALRPASRPRPRPLPLAVETTQPLRRVVLIGIDGLGPRQLEQGLARGTLPEMARLVRRGAYGALATLRPTQGPPVWTSVFTGHLPRDHGVKSFGTYRLLASPTTFEILPARALVGVLERAGFVSTGPVTAGVRKRRALWEALNAFGIETGVVRFWGTHPPERVKGFMLSNYFHLLQRDPAHAAGALFPPDLLAELRARAVEPRDVDPALVSEFLDLTAPGERERGAGPRAVVERALASDLTYKRAGAVLRSAYDPPFFAMYFYGLDVMGHAFLRYAEPQRFGDVPLADVRRYGHALSRYATFLDGSVGEAARSLRPGEILIVVSGYGMEPVPLWRRLLSSMLGEPSPSGTHAGAPDGVILALGDGVRPGGLAQGASVLDVTPTILYLMGLPVARDMDGRVLTEMLDEDFTRAHPVTYIPSYESLAVTPMAAPPLPDLPPLPGDEP